MWVTKIYLLQAIVELLDDDDFQKLACNPKARAIVEEVHGNRDAFRKYALSPLFHGCGGKDSESGHLQDAFHYPLFVLSRAGKLFRLPRFRKAWEGLLA